MKLPRFFGKLRRRKPLIVRRVVGASMLPTLREGQVVWATGLRRIRPGAVVLFRHNAVEKIKRVERIEPRGVYVLGDNPSRSTDSRHFGLVPIEDILAVLINQT